MDKTVAAADTCWGFARTSNHKFYLQIGTVIYWEKFLEFAWALQPFSICGNKQSNHVVMT